MLVFFLFIFLKGKVVKRIKHELDEYSDAYEKDNCTFQYVIHFIFFRISFYLEMLCDALKIKKEIVLWEKVEEGIIVTIHIVNR